MSKLSEDFRIGVMGAAAGLLSSSVTLLIARIDTYYAWLRDTSYEKRIEDLWWVPVSVWHIILSVVAALLVHRYLTIRPSSPFLLWQVVGLTTLVGWLLSFFLVVSLNCIMHGNLSSLEYLVNSDDVGVIAKYFATVFASNVFYGSVISASSRQYLPQFDHAILNQHSAESCEKLVDSF